MKMVITGTTGFIGKNLFNFFSKKNDVIPFHRGDDPNIIIKEKPEIIIHSAAEIYNEEKMFDSNIKLSYDIFKAAKDINFKLLFYIGSSSEYGRKEEPITEKDSLNPETLYEATKASASMLCRSFAFKNNKPMYIIRPFSVYGNNEPKHRLIPSLLRCALSEETIKISEAYHDFIHIDDFIYGINLLIHSKNIIKTGDIINFGTGHQYSNMEVLRIMEKILNKKIKHEKCAPLRIFDSNSWVCNTAYAYEKYGLKFSISLEEGLKKYIYENS